jgi:D-sedoheptulose 7-phosphate isomerase
MNYTERYQRELAAALERVDLRSVDQCIDCLREARRCGRRVFVFGNGGSSSTASHFVCDMVKGASYGYAARFRIMALTEAIATITAYSNDVGYDCIFAEQLKNFAQPGDVVVAISGSGNSPNVIRAVEYANSAGCTTIGLTGRDGGRLAPLVDLNIHVPEQHMGRIEDAHMIICHMISYSFMEEPATEEGLPVAKTEREVDVAVVTA